SGYFFNRILHQRLIHDGEHFLGLRFGGGQEPRAKTGNRQNRFTNLHEHLSLSHDEQASQWAQCSASAQAASKERGWGLGTGGWGEAEGGKLSPVTGKGQEIREQARTAASLHSIAPVPSPQSLLF